MLLTYICYLFRSFIFISFIFINFNFISFIIIFIFISLIIIPKRFTKEISEEIYPRRFIDEALNRCSKMKTQNDAQTLIISLIIISLIIIIFFYLSYRFFFASYI
jgi:hypothetical protein